MDTVRARQSALVILTRKAEVGHAQIEGRAQARDWLLTSVVQARQAITRRNTTQAWLAVRARFVKRRNAVFVELSERGENALRACVLREQSQQWLSQRGRAARSNLLVLLKNSERRQVVDAFQHDAQAWLAQRVHRAQAHVQNKYESIVWMQRRARLAIMTIAEQRRALSELWTLASHAMLESFRRLARSSGHEKERIRTESVRIPFAKDCCLHPRFSLTARL